MAAKRQPAKSVARRRDEGWYWIDHAAVGMQDLDWLQSVERLTLWNVELPPGFLGRLPRLWWLDLRGGSALDLRGIADAGNLEYLALNQIRALGDLSLLPQFSKLRYLNIYGLAQVSALPSLRALSKLERLAIGQMRGLSALGAALDAPNLRELCLLRKIGVSAEDIRRINSHPALRQFLWMSEDVPMKVSEPVIRGITLPEAQAMHPEQWFEART